MSDQRDQALRFMTKYVAIRRLMLGDDLKPLPDAEIFLDDIGQFCHAEATTHVFDENGRSDPLAAAQLEGRRQVWLRISAYINMTERELSAIGQTLMEDDENE